ncbi:ABC transporter substrate-binding protein [Streptomyces sp. NPDC001380]|uniref:ABC transporter substrate-binding protein n=1 Tax=Streptomyces sp. NPDC001380 TaxID=3364566 RepID=UPI0036A09514
MSAVTRLAVLGCVGLVASTVAACGSSTPGGAGEGAKAITMGTTAVTSTLDPAGAYDAGSWMLLANTHQTLLSFPAGATTPQPEAAQSCSFAGGSATEYTCTLRSGLKFSNGHPLTAQDVVFSFTRMKKIHDPSGPADIMLSTLASIEAKGSDQVVFHLNAPDAVFPSKIATPAGAIVDHQVYPAASLLPNSRMVGSGPYKVDGIDEMPAADGGARIPGTVHMSANPDYKGIAKLENSAFNLRYFNEASQMKSALDSGDVDLTDNGLDPKDVLAYKDAALKGTGGVKIVEGTAAETRYLVFNTKDPVVGRTAVRRAVAQLLDRKAIARDSHQRTVQALYSVVPAGILGSNTAFYSEYGDPSVDAARRILRTAGIKAPVDFSLTWSRTGVNRVEAEQIKQQLEASGLFRVEVKQEADWTTFTKNWQRGVYQAYTVSWVPDYPDADDYIVPLVVQGGTFANSWDSPQITGRLIPQTRRIADRSATLDQFAAMQRIVAHASPLVPLWQSKSFYACKDNIGGLESTVDVTGVFRFWQISRIDG